jgi:hypothetical protein
MRALVLLALLAVAAASNAQLPRWTQVVATAKAGWKSAVEAGRPLATRIAKETPERFRAARRRADDLLAQGDRYLKSGDLQHKQALVAELWRVRGSLDLMSLLDPMTLKMLGIDVPDLTKLRANVSRQIRALGR